MDPKNLGVSCGQRILHKNQIVKFADLCIKWLYHSPSIITSKVFQLFIGIVPLVKNSHAITVGLLGGKSHTWLLRFFSEIIDCIISLLVLELEVKVIFLLGKSRPDGLRFEIGSWRNCVFDLDHHGASHCCFHRAWWRWCPRISGEEDDQKGGG